MHGSLVLLYTYCHSNISIRWYIPDNALRQSPLFKRSRPGFCCHTRSVLPLLSESSTGYSSGTGCHAWTDVTYGAYFMVIPTDTWMSCESTELCKEACVDASFICRSITYIESMDLCSLYTITKDGASSAYFLSTGQGPDVYMALVSSECTGRDSNGY